MKMIAIAGSLRKGSFNKQLAEAAGRYLEGRADFEILEYADVPFMNQDMEHPAPEAVSRVRQKIKEADGIWFFTPEYNHFFPGVLKNLIDWLSRPVNGMQGQVLAGKPAAISGITVGMSGTAIAQDHLVTLLSFLNMDIMNQPRLAIPNAMEQMKDGVLSLDKSADYLEKQADAFLSYIQKNKR